MCAYATYSTENLDCFCNQKLFNNKTHRTQMIMDGLENRHQQCSENSESYFRTSWSWSREAFLPLLLF